MAQKKKTNKATQLNKKVVVKLNRLKSLEKLSKTANELNRTEGENIGGGKINDADMDTVETQWPTGVK